MSFTISQLEKLLPKDIVVIDLFKHTKLKQKMVKTTFIQDGTFEFTTYVPYIDMNKGINHLTVEEVADYLKSIKKYFSREWIESWVKEQRDKWAAITSRDDTKPFLELQLSLKLEDETFGNPNYASRLRDLRKLGYTITSVYNKTTQKYSRIMLPLPLHPESTYETVPKNITQTLARLKRYIEAYSGDKMDEDFLLADHKFPESRWDENTSKDNNPNMKEDEIIRKFQLLDNASNLRKKQMCESCAATGVRPSIYGLTYFYKGKAKWDPSIPEMGEGAEEGCIGCPWYDIEEWKKQFNERFRREFE